jgi:hypothetical protein
MDGEMDRGMDMYCYATSITGMMAGLCGHGNRRSNLLINKVGSCNSFRDLATEHIYLYYVYRYLYRHDYL